MSKQYAYLHTMAKTSVKFQNDWPKTVGGVALTRHPLSIVEERTNGRMYEWTGHGTPISHLRANAGATITKNECNITLNTSKLSVKVTRHFFFILYTRKMYHITHHLKYLIPSNVPSCLPSENTCNKYLI